MQHNFCKRKRQFKLYCTALQIHPDPLCDKDKREHMQWFYFRVSNALDETLNCRIINAGQASFPRAWRGYNVCASYDRCGGTGPWAVVERL